MRMRDLNVSFYTEVLVETNFEDMFDELTARQQKDFMLDKLDSVCSVQEAMSAYGEQDILNYIQDNFTKEELDNLYK